MNTNPRPPVIDKSQPPPFAKPWWETRWLMAAMVLLSFLPLLIPPIPPLVDLPGHMGRYAVELGLDQSPFLQKYYQYHWVMAGNLGVDLLIIPMSHILGIELGTKLIILIIAPMTVAGLLWITHEIHGRITPSALFALPFAWSHPFLFGFVNYELGMALTLIAFGWWLQMARTKHFKRRMALFVPISFIIFITHAFAWGVLGLLCLAAETIRYQNQNPHWLRAIKSASRQVLCLAGPLLLLIVWRQHQAAGNDTIGWLIWPSKLLWLEAALRDRWFDFDRISVGLVLVVLLIARLTKNLGFASLAGAPALILGAAFLIMPQQVYGSNYADMRLIPYVLALMLVAIRFKKTDHQLAAATAHAGLAFFGVRLAATTLSLCIASATMDRELTALETLPLGARVLFINTLKCQSWDLRRNTTLGALVIVRKQGLTNSEWKVPGAPLLSVRPELGLGRWANDPSQQVFPNQCKDQDGGIDEALTSFPHDKFDYVWIVQKSPFNPTIVANWDKLYEDQDSVLFKISPPPSRHRKDDI